MYFLNCRNFSAQFETIGELINYLSKLKVKKIKNYNFKINGVKILLKSGDFCFLIASRKDVEYIKKSLEKKQIEISREVK